MNKKGLFITFEGIEGCGKSTQAKLLAEELRSFGQSVLLTREPGGPRISEEIRSLLLNKEFTEMNKHTEVFLYMASRAQHTQEWIIPALSDGKIVICDRYYDSTFAYQGAARDIPKDDLNLVNTFATSQIDMLGNDYNFEDYSNIPNYHDSDNTYNIPVLKNDLEIINVVATIGLKPDVTYIIDVPVEIGLERLHNGTKAEDIDRLESEDMDFHRRVRKGFLKLSEEEPERIVVIDGKQSIEEIHQDIMKNMKQRYNDLLGE